MENKKSGNLSKSDVISFVAIMLLGITVFFGMNFKTLGDKIPSVLVAVVIVVLMTVFVFLAAYAKLQNRNQAMWKMVEKVMVALYIVALIPCYMYSAKFYGIYFNKKEITQQVENDFKDIDKVFADYSRNCESRGMAYQTKLEAMLTYAQGRARIAKLLDIKAESVNQTSVRQASESFINCLKGGEYQALETEKDNLKNTALANFKNWNILLLPQYVDHLNGAKERFTAELKNIYDKYNNDIEQSVPEFNPEVSTSETNITSRFTESEGFSIFGLIGVIIFGGLGLLKYVFGEKRTVIDLKEGSAKAITDDGGFTF